MLRRQNGTGTMDRPISRVWRVVTTCTLLGLTLGLATLRGPARGGEREEPPAAPPYIVSTTTRAAGTPIIPPYVPDRNGRPDRLPPGGNVPSDGFERHHAPARRVPGYGPLRTREAIQSHHIQVGLSETGRRGHRVGGRQHPLGSRQERRGGRWPQLYDRQSDCPHGRPIRLPGVPAPVAFRLRQSQRWRPCLLQTHGSAWREPLDPIPACACSTIGPSSSTRRRRSVRSWAGKHLSHRPISGGRPGSGPAAGCSRTRSITRTERSRNSTTWDCLMMR